MTQCLLCYRPLRPDEHRVCHACVALYEAWARAEIEDRERGDMSDRAWLLLKDAEAMRNYDGPEPDYSGIGQAERRERDIKDWEQFKGSGR